MWQYSFTRCLKHWGTQIKLYQTIFCSQLWLIDQNSICYIVHDYPPLLGSLLAYHGFGMSHQNDTVFREWHEAKHQQKKYVGHKYDQHIHDISWRYQQIMRVNYIDPYYPSRGTFWGESTSVFPGSQQFPWLVSPHHYMATLYMVYIVISHFLHKITTWVTNEGGTFRKSTLSSLVQNQIW